MDDLVKICLLFDERYMSDDYRSTEFARYDDFRHETDKGIIEDLDEKLLNMIKITTMKTPFVSARIC